MSIILNGRYIEDKDIGTVSNCYTDQVQNSFEIACQVNTVFNPIELSSVTLISNNRLFW